MSKAVFLDTTAAVEPLSQSRRALFGAGAAMLAGAAVARAVAPAVVAEPDNELRDLVTTLHQQWEVADAIAAEGKLLPPHITPESEAQEARLAAALEYWWRTAERIVETPARSPAGLKAKAAAMHETLNNLRFTRINRTKFEQLQDADLPTQMAWSLAADMLGSGLA